MLCTEMRWVFVQKPYTYRDKCYQSPSLQPRYRRPDGMRWYWLYNGWVISLEIALPFLAYTPKRHLWRRAILFHHQLQSLPMQSVFFFTRNVTAILCGIQILTRASLLKQLNYCVFCLFDKEASIAVVSRWAGILCWWESVCHWNTEMIVKWVSD